MSNIRERQRIIKSVGTFVVVLVVSIYLLWSTFSLISSYELIQNNSNQLDRITDSLQGWEMMENYGENY